MERRGKCNNVGVCTHAGKIFVIKDDEDFICPECGEPLIEVKEEDSEDILKDARSRKQKKAIGVLAVVIAILAIICIFLLTGGEPKAEKLTFDKSQMILKVGETDQLNLTIEPAEAQPQLLWQSTNDSVVSVNNGFVKALKAGKAQVKVFVMDNEIVNAVCEYTVVETDVDMQTLDIVQDPLILRPGGHQQLTVNYTPEDQNETISWSSTDETVATVSPRGKVDAIKVGLAFIIAKSDRTGVADTASVSVEGPAEMSADNTSETKAPASKPAVTPTTKPAVAPTTKPVATQVPKPAAQTKPTVTPSPKPATASASGSKNLGYATFKGSWPNDVNGRMVFKTSHIIDSKDPKKRVAEAGDYVIGEWSEGHLVQGIWYGADNTVKGSVIIGK